MDILFSILGYLVLLPSLILILFMKDFSAFIFFVILIFSSIMLIGIGKIIGLQKKILANIEFKQTKFK